MINDSISPSIIIDASSAQRASRTPNYVCYEEWASIHASFPFASPTENRRTARNRTTNAVAGAERRSIDGHLPFPSAFGSCQHSRLSLQYSSFIQLKWEKFGAHGGRASARKRWTNCHHTRILVRFRIQITCAFGQNRFNQISKSLLCSALNLLLAPETPRSQSNKLVEFVRFSCFSSSLSLDMRSFRFLRRHIITNCLRSGCAILSQNIDISSDIIVSLLI